MLVVVDAPALEAEVLTLSLSLIAMEQTSPKSAVRLIFGCLVHPMLTLCSRSSAGCVCCQVITSSTLAIELPLPHIMSVSIVRISADYSERLAINDRSCITLLAFCSCQTVQSKSSGLSVWRRDAGDKYDRLLTVQGSDWFRAAC